jgi:hypothetical protein
MPKTDSSSVRKYSRRKNEDLSRNEKIALIGTTAAVSQLAFAIYISLLR